MLETLLSHLYGLFLDDSALPLRELASSSTLTLLSDQPPSHFCTTNFGIASCLLWLAFDFGELCPLKAKRGPFLTVFNLIFIQRPLIVCLGDQCVDLRELGAVF